MSRPDQRRLPLLVVLMALLALLGAAVLDGLGSRVAPASATAAATHLAAPADGSAGADDARGTVDPAADVHDADDRPGERSLVVRWSADHRRPPVPNAPALMVLVAALVAGAGAGAYVAPAARGVVCRVAHAHVRRRGPPALAVI